jgi:hypothetical protein
VKILFLHMLNQQGRALCGSSQGLQGQPDVWSFQNQIASKIETLTPRQNWNSSLETLFWNLAGPVRRFRGPNTGIISIWKAIVPVTSATMFKRLSAKIRSSSPARKRASSKVEPAAQEDQSLKWLKAIHNAQKVS